MPRPLKHRTELRQIRDALAEAEGRPVTQEILAQRLQTSKSYINAIEAGTKQMTAKFAHRLLQTFGVICAHPSLQPPPEIGPYEERTPFAPRDRTNLANGIRLHLRRPKSDGREMNARALHPAPPAGHCRRRRRARPPPTGSGPSAGPRNPRRTPLLKKQSVNSVRLTLFLRNNP